MLLGRSGGDSGVATSTTVTNDNGITIALALSDIVRNGIWAGGTAGALPELSNRPGGGLSALVVLPMRS